MEGKRILDDSQNVDGWVWKVLEPVLTPVCYEMQMNKNVNDQNEDNRCSVLTENTGEHLEADELVVLEELDERKREHGQVLGLTEDGRPVRKRRQHAVTKNIDTSTCMKTPQEKE